MLEFFKQMHCFLYEKFIKHLKVLITEIDGKNIQIFAWRMYSARKIYLKMRVKFSRVS